MSTLIPTGVADTAAAHLAYIRASTSTEDYLTIVWSTRRIRCVPGDPGHASAQWDEETVPMVWDSTGCGDWDVGDHVQCGSDGVLLYPHARIAEGHLPDEQVRDLALRVAREAGTHPAVDVVTLVYTVKVYATIDLVNETVNDVVVGDEILTFDYITGEGCDTLDPAIDTVELRERAEDVADNTDWPAWRFGW